MARTICALLLAAGVAALTGCARTGFHSVSGVVTMGGQPVEGAIVIFHPADNTEGGGQVANGVTDSGGKFKMGTINNGDGVKPGKYKVTVFRPTEKLERQKTMSEVMAEMHSNKGENKNIGKEALQVHKEEIAEAAKKAKANPTPEAYNDPKTTPLVADVPAQTDYTFDLKTNAK